MDIVDALKWYLVFVFSTSCHEAAHAWAAWKLGDDTARRGGQVTLDPTPHIRREPIGMVVVPLASYFLRGWMIGWASTPYNRAWALENPRRAGVMAFAGPAANFALMLLAGLIIRAGVEWHYFQVPESLTFMHMTQAVEGGWADFAANILSLFFSLNLLLATFNLIPLPPLDGANLPLLFSSRETAHKIFGVIRHPSLQWIGILVAWNVFPQIFHPVQRFAAHLLYPGVIYR